MTPWLAVELLRPEPVFVAPGHECLGALAPGVRPTLFPGPLVHRVSGEHRPGRAPHQLLERVVSVLAGALKQELGRLRPRIQPPRYEQQACLSPQEGRFALRRELDLGCAEIRLLTPELQSPVERGGEVDGRFRVAAAAERIERPDHATRAAVEILHGHRRAPRIPFIGRPEAVRIESSPGVGDDRADPRANALFVPGLVGERLELVRRVEHQESLTKPGLSRRAALSAPRRRPQSAL